jgi:hypothetical protein
MYADSFLQIAHQGAQNQITVGFLLANTFEEKFLPSTVFAVKVSFALFVVNEAWLYALAGAVVAMSNPAAIENADSSEMSECFFIISPLDL